MQAVAVKSDTNGRRAAAGSREGAGGSRVRTIAAKAGAAVRDGPGRRKQRELSAEEKWASYERALVITAHPDDAEFIAGGTIAKLCDMGLDVTIAIATSGDKGTRDPNMRPQELAAIREAEQRAAAAVLGIKRCIFLGYPDGFLEEGPELRGHFVRLIRTLRPDIIITWDGFRAGFNHTDHRVVGRCVRDALYPAAHDPHYYAELTRAAIGPWRTAEALLAATPDAGFHVDVGAYLEKKVDALLCHTSQIEGTRDGMLKAMRERARRDKERRRVTGFEFSESFQRIEFRRPAGAPGTPEGAATAPAKSAAKRRAAERV
jgi:LmbE family N-acetylglucosaminyl deacetylase